MCACGKCGQAKDTGSRLHRDTAVGVAALVVPLSQYEMPVLGPSDRWINLGSAFGI
jgi:hypothetical protein